MTGAEFVEAYAKKGLPAWEAAAFQLAKQGQLTPWPWVPLTLTDGRDTVVLQVASDVLSVGPIGEHVRLPLQPGTAQDILNLSGSLLTTPWIEYQIWRAAPMQARMRPTPMPVNADLAKFYEHSRLIDGQLAANEVQPGTLVTGITAKAAVDVNGPHYEAMTRAASRGESYELDVKNDAGETVITAVLGPVEDGPDPKATVH